MKHHELETGGGVGAGGSGCVGVVSVNLSPRKVLEVGPWAFLIPYVLFDLETEPENTQRTLKQSRSSTRVWPAARPGFVPFSEASPRGVGCPAFS